jgi:hypothetical protein
VAHQEADLHTLRQCKLILAKEAQEVSSQNEDLLFSVKQMKRKLVQEQKERDRMSLQVKHSVKMLGTIKEQLNLQREDRRKREYYMQKVSFSAV